MDLSLETDQSRGRQCRRSNRSQTLILQVVGCEYDRLEQEEQPDCLAFETVYSLLSHISPSYVSSFHHALSDKLDRVKNTSNPGTVEVGGAGFLTL